jgi:Protein of unknown function (DUF4240)
MDREQFWALIKAAKAATGGDCQAQTAQLVAALRQRPVGEILAYHRVERELMVESYRWDLWGAAYLINGGCSDDGFAYFRGWLLTQGRATWEATVADPDSLAAHPQVQASRRQGPRAGSLWCEHVLGAADDAYEAVTGQELTVEVAAGRRSAVTAEDLQASMGEDFDFDDAEEMRRRYPRLWAVCGWN